MGLINWFIVGVVAHFGLPLGRFQNDKNKKHKTPPKKKQRTTNTKLTPKKGVGLESTKKSVINRIDFGEYLILRPTLFG